MGLYRFTSLVRTDAPVATDVVALATVKAHLRKVANDEDEILGVYLAQAIGHCEEETGRALGPQTWSIKMDGFDAPAPVGGNRGAYPDRGRIFLPRPPLLEVDSVKYLDADGVERDLDEDLFSVDIEASPGEIRLKDGASWPSTLVAPDAVRIVYGTGYGGDAGPSVPPSIVGAILLLVGHYYENREAVNVGNIVSEYPLAVKSLLNPFRIVQL